MNTARIIELVNERVARGQGYHEAWCAVNRTNPELWLANDGGGETANEGTSDGALAGWETRKMGDKAAAKTQEHYGAAKAKADESVDLASRGNWKDASVAAYQSTQEARRGTDIARYAEDENHFAHKLAMEAHNHAARAHSNLVAKINDDHVGTDMATEHEGLAKLAKDQAGYHKTRLKQVLKNIGNEGQPCGASHIAPGQTCHVGQGLPKLGAGEKGTGGMFKSQDQPFNLAGGQTKDGDRVAREAAKAEIDRAEDCRLTERTKHYGSLGNIDR